jgi:Type I phosphodiesterase / nucleotide pyrophosphatase
MNFQAPNIAQKFSGYVDAAGTTPQDHTTLGPLAPSPPGLAQALDYVDGAIGRMLDRIDPNGLTDETMIILTAKHANSPVDRGTLRWVDPAAFAPLINSVQAGLTAQVTADTMALIWLKAHWHDDRVRRAQCVRAACGRTDQRNDWNAARISSLKSCGCSQAAKWPPLSALLK